MKVWARSQLTQGLYSWTLARFAKKKPWISMISHTHTHCKRHHAGLVLAGRATHNRHARPKTKGSEQIQFMTRSDPGSHGVEAEH